MFAMGFYEPKFSRGVCRGASGDLTEVSDLAALCSVPVRGESPSCSVRMFLGDNAWAAQEDAPQDAPASPFVVVDYDGDDAWARRLPSPETAADRAAIYSRHLPKDAPSVSVRLFLGEQPWTLGL